MARAPRDIDADLAAHTAQAAEKARRLHEKRIAQWGAIVLDTVGGKLTVQEIAGLLLAGRDQAANNPQAKGGWRRRGEEFFQRPRRARPQVRARDAAARAASDGSGPAAPGDGTAAG